MCLHGESQLYFVTDFPCPVNPVIVPGLNTCKHFAIQRDFRAFTPKRDTQIQILVPPLCNGQQYGFAIRIISGHTKPKILAFILRINILVDKEVMSPFGIEKSRQQGDDTMSTCRTAIGPMKVAIRLYAIRGV